MNLDQLKKRVLIESGILGVVLVSLVGVTYLLSTIGDDYTESNNAMHAKVQAIDIELEGLQRKYTFIMQNAELYHEVQKRQTEGKLLIKRQVAYDMFNLFRSEFNLGNLRLTVSPVNEMKDAKYKRNSNTVSFSSVNAETEVLYDDNIYQLLNAMQQELPGICVISRLNMALSKPVDSEVLRTIGTKGTFPLVKASISFNWYSINPVEVSDPNSDATKK